MNGDKFNLKGSAHRLLIWMTIEYLNHYMVKEHNLLETLLF